MRNRVDDLHAITTAPSSWACSMVLYPPHFLKLSPAWSTANLKSKLALSGKMTDKGGRRMSETKEVTTVVKAWARLREGGTDKRWKLVLCDPNRFRLLLCTPCGVTHIKPKAISRMFPCVAKSTNPSRMRRVLRVPYSMRLSSSWPLSARRGILLLRENNKKEKRKIENPMTN